MVVVITQPNQTKPTQPNPTPRGDGWWVHILPLALLFFQVLPCRCTSFHFCLSLNHIFIYKKASIKFSFFHTKMFVFVCTDNRGSACILEKPFFILFYLYFLTSKPFWSFNSGICICSFLLSQLLTLTIVLVMIVQLKYRV